MKNNQETNTNQRKYKDLRAGGIFSILKNAKTPQSLFQLSQDQEMQQSAL